MTKLILCNEPLYKTCYKTNMCRWIGIFVISEDLLIDILTLLPACLFSSLAWSAQFITPTTLRMFAFTGALSSSVDFTCPN